MQKGRKGEGWRKPDKRDEIEECLECSRTDCSGICDRIRSMEAETKKTGRGRKAGEAKPVKEPKGQNSQGYQTREDLLAEIEMLRRENEGLRMRIPPDRNARFRVRDRATGTEYEGTKAELQEKMGKGKNEITDMIRHLMRYELEVL